MEVAILDTPQGLKWAEDALIAQDRTYALIGNGEEAWQKAAAQALADGSVDAVLPFSEQHVTTAARITDELDLPGTGLRAALTSRNKYLQRDLFSRHGLPQPDYALTQTAKEAVSWACGHYPVVVKPLSEMGSAGVRIVFNEVEMVAWWEEHAGLTPFLVERYVAGPEHSVEAVIHAGEVVFAGLTAKTTTSPPYCVELGHSYPAVVSAGQRAEIDRVLAGVVHALGMGSGIMHLELRSGTGGPRIMEVAVRTPGDRILDVVEAASGIDLYDAVLDVVLGRRPALAGADTAVACAWFPELPAGTVTAIHGADTVTRLEGVVDVEVDVEPGGTIAPLRSSMDRMAMVLVRAPDEGTLDARLKSVRDMLRFDITPLDDHDGHASSDALAGAEDGR
ncbi:ATP-grasp domain-containing protein [Actinomadura pelletieri]|nr:ATP-grasp domain-containing protein [Actinomadura pelletieri]